MGERPHWGWGTASPQRGEVVQKGGIGQGHGIPEMVPRSSYVKNVKHQGSVPFVGRVSAAVLVIPDQRLTRLPLPWGSSLGETPPPLLFSAQAELSPADTGEGGLGLQGARWALGDARLVDRIAFGQNLNVS